MIKYIWEINTHWTYKNDYSASVKHTQFHVVASNIIQACEKVNKIIAKAHDKHKKSNLIGTRNEKKLPVIWFVERQKVIDS